MVRAFTLIELLIVVTIIAVLLAMLTPAVDRAIYQAELAVCESHLHTLGTTALIYAGEFRRCYPYRPGVEANDPGVGAIAWNAPLMALGSTNAGGRERATHYDEMPILKPYLSINRVMNDPLSKSVDMEGSSTETSVFSSYFLGYNLKFPGHGPMKRLGDKMVWTQKEGAKTVTHSSGVLACDRDWLSNANGNTATSHPDDRQMLVNAVYQDQDLGGLGAFTLLAGKLTQSYWPGTNGRGLIDSNYLFDDASVRRYGGVVRYTDDRMTRAPADTKDSDATLGYYLPASIGAP